MSTNLHNCGHCICKRKHAMYDGNMTESRKSEESQIDLEALRAAMARRGWLASDLAVASGVHKSTLSLLLKGERANSPAVIVARLAVALGVSVDYLMGLTRNPAPKPDDLSRLLVELQSAARQLPEERQRDLLLIARAFRHANAEDAAETETQRRREQSVLNVLERHYGREQAEEILAILASEFPELGIDGDNIPPGEEDAA